MADVMRLCIMHHYASEHQVLELKANNSDMQSKTRTNILSLMQSNGIESERQLALSCGMEQSTLHRFMSGKTESLNLTHLTSIAHYFEITVSQLIGETPITEDPRMRTVMLAMESLPDYKKDMLVAASLSLSSRTS